MRTLLITAGFLTIAAANAERGDLYKWEDEDGNIYYSDKVPPEYAERDKERITPHGVPLEEIEGRKTEEELEEERRQAELDRQRAEQLRADTALLNTYLTVAEIENHRDRRIELFQAQARVTELFLKNQQARLERLEREASRYQPYSSDADAPMVDPGLVEEINETRSTIERHTDNLRKYTEEEQAIRRQFEHYIARFRELKGLE